MTWVVLLVVTMAAAFLQVQLPGLAWLGQAKPPLLLAVTIYYALHRETEVMLLAAVLAGFLQDALSPAPLGLSAVVFVLAGWTLTRFRDLLMSEAAVAQAFLGLAAAGLGGLVQALLLLGGGTLALGAGAIAHKVLGLALLGLVVTPLVCRAIDALDRLFGNVRIVKEVEGTDGEFDRTAE